MHTIAIASVPHGVGLTGLLILILVIAASQAAFTNIIDRDGAEALIPEEVVSGIFKEIPTSCKMMQLFRRLPNMSRKQDRLKVMNALPHAYFVNGDTGLKRTTEAAWENKYLNAEEIAVIVPVPEAVLDDSEHDIFAEITPQVAAAFGAVIDGAVFIGTDAPENWPDDLKTAAAAAGHSVDLSTVEGTGGTLYDALLGSGGTISLLEADGFMASAHVGPMAVRAELRDLKDGVDRPLYVPSMQDPTRYALDGSPMEFFDNGAVAASDALLFSAAWKELVWAMRQDMTVKLLDQAVITDNSGAVVYNLPQQDMVALRFVMRLGWQVPNPVKRINQTEATRFPVAVLVP